MKRKIIQAKANNMLCLLSTCSTVQPFSLQPSVQVEVPLDEYVLLVKSMCENEMMLFDSIFGLSQYRTAVIEFFRGNKHNVNILFTFDMFKACVMELKKAVSRGREATVITIDYCDEKVNTMQFDKMYSYLNLLFQTEGNDHHLFNKAIEEINRTYNTIPIDFMRLSEHNKCYYSYVAILRYSLASASEGNKFVPFNVDM